MNGDDAIQALRAGRLVVIPTETVYGLAADATLPDAVAEIFRLKGRPAENPLIAHFASVGDIDEFAETDSEYFLPLVTAFWPGPLTLVLPYRGGLAPQVTAGLATLAVRIPAVEVTRAIIAGVGHPLAAPSANPFMRLSPTRAEDVGGSIVSGSAGVVDGGPCAVGLESTIIDLTREVPTLLRLGMVSATEIAKVLGVQVDERKPDEVISAPGQYLRHYSPKTPLNLVHKLGDQPGIGFGRAGNHQVQMPEDPVRYARDLYASLAKLDQLGLDAIYVESVPDDPSWGAIRDRLSRATNQG
ncbi:MAG: threonylcarbamoyl-AMP synthase [Armatimonadetes bacterium]|nr:threonylcarbamoyl-AMP synthase [Armatimonadota bacterium]